MSYHTTMMPPHMSRARPWPCTTWHDAHTCTSLKKHNPTVMAVHPCDIPHQRATFCMSTMLSVLAAPTAAAVSCAIHVVDYIKLLLCMRARALAPCMHAYTCSYHLDCSMHAAHTSRVPYHMWRASRLHCICAIRRCGHIPIIPNVLQGQQPWQGCVMTCCIMRLWVACIATCR